VATALFIRPEGDPAATDLSEWCAELIATTVAAGHAVEDLQGEAATRGRVEEVLAGAEAVFFFGHGDWDALPDASGSPLVDRANVSLASGHGIVAMACDTGYTFGPDAIVQGVEAFLGFIEDFAWPPPCRIDGEDHFKGVVVEALRPLVEGGTIQDSTDALREGFERVHRHYRYDAGRNDSSNPLAYMLADLNRYRVVLLGNPVYAPLA
jgi:hypothetical protein